MLRAGKVFFLDSNLSSPILTTELKNTRDFLKDYQNFKLGKGDWDHYTRKALNAFGALCKLRSWKPSDLVSCDQLIPELYPRVEELMLVPNLTLVSHYREAAIIAGAIARAHVPGFIERGINPTELEETVPLLMSPHADPYRSCYEQWSNFFGRAESRIKNRDVSWTYGQIGSVEFWITTSLALVKFEGIMYTSSLNQVLMLKDKVATRYMMLEHILPLGLDTDLVGHMTKLFQWQDSVLSGYGNQGYNILKATEPMYKTYLSHISDNVFGDDTAYTRMVIKMNEKEKKLSKGKKNLLKIGELDQLVRETKSIKNIVEMFGALKTCGHPIIDPELGGLSAAEEAQSPDITCISDAQDLRNVFCHIMLTSYVSQHGKWPPLSFRRPGLTLEILCARQERMLDYGSYNLDEWTSVEWEKLFDMDYYPNFLELMDDKSISYYRSDKHLSWCDGKPKSQRRLLLEVLTRQEIDIEELVRRVSRGEIPYDWYIISLYPKEREFKIDARMFAMFCLEMRCFFTCTEANIADHIFKYLPQQTMTKTKTQVQERFLALTDPARSLNTWSLFLEIDLSRWNLRWRKMTIHMLGHDFNRMFGVKGTFTTLHNFFEKAQIIVRVPGLKPKGIEDVLPPASALAWRDHMGGLEGIGQKQWSVATYAMITLALLPLLRSGKIKSFELIGQGDNQVIRIEIPRTQELREVVLPRLRDEVNGLLEATCLSVNQIVKPEENIESTTVLTYSKDVYVRGVEYPLTLKKHSRLFPITASDFPSTTSHASAVMAGAVAAAECSRYPLKSAVIGWYHTARYLLAASAGYCIHGKDSVRLTSHQIILALLLPPSIGGLIGTPIASFMYKGGSDPLGKEISSLRLVASSKCEVGRAISSALRGLEERYHISLSPNLDILIDNPYGLPLDANPSPLSRVSHLTLDAFKGKVRNKDIEPLLSPSVASAEAILKKDILSVEPLNPILAHDLYDSSGFGTLKIIKKMFLTTRTVQTIAQWVNPNITHTFLKADLNQLRGFQLWVKGFPSRGYSGANSFDLVSKFRSYWRRSLHGVTNYQPLDCFHSAGTVRNLSSIKWSCHRAEDILESRGPLTGYLGTSTREKRSEHGYKIVDAGAPTRAMNKLQLIRSQAHGNRHFNELLDRIGLTRTRTILSQITDLLQTVIGGSISHRYASAIRELAAAYVGPLNFVTHIRIDTDSLGKLSGSSFNYPIMIQEFMVLVSCVAKMTVLNTQFKCGELLVDTERMVPLPEDSLECPPPLFQSASIPQTKLLYTPVIMISRTYDSTARVVPHGSVAIIKDYGTMRILKLTLVGFFMDMLRDSSRAKILADTRSTQSIPSRLQLDIAEAHALGPTVILKSAAQAIVATTLRDTFRTLHLHPDRWDSSVFSVHSIRSCIRAVSVYWSHPLFRLHIDYPRYASSRLRYSGHMSQEKRLESVIRREITTILSTLTHPFWDDPVPSFSGSDAMTLVEALTLSGIKAILRLYIMSDPHALEFSSIMTSFLAVPVRTVMTVETLLELMRTRFTRLSAYYRKQGDHLLADKIMSVAKCQTVLAFNDDIRTVLRYARLLQPGVGEIRSLRTLPSVSITSQPPDVCEKCCPNPVSKYFSLWRINEKRVHGGYSTAGYTWIPLLGVLRVSKHIRIIGSGNGGLADLLITAFGCHVVGYDLESDMPKESATLLNYIPIGISSFNASSYSQSDLCLTTDGDWLTFETRQSILKESSAGSTLFIDITGPSPDEIINTLVDVFSYSLINVTYARLIGDISLWEALKNKLSNFTYRVWVFSITTVSLEIIVEVQRKDSLYLHSCIWPKPLYEEDLTLLHELIPRRSNQLRDSATLSVLYWDNETPDVMTDILQNMCGSLLNKTKKNQLLYSDRVNLMVAYACLYATTSANPMDTVFEWIGDELIETDMFDFPLKEWVITHLLRYTPRMMSLLQSS
jgi:hypothetical protein